MEEYHTHNDYQSNKNSVCELGYTHAQKSHQYTFASSAISEALRFADERIAQTNSRPTLWDALNNVARCKKNQ